MKKFFFTLCVALAALPMLAQTPYACLTKGAVLEYATYDESDNVTYDRQVIQEVNDLGDGNYDFRIAISDIEKPGQEDEGSGVMLTAGEVRNGGVKVSVSGMEGSIDVTGSDPELCIVPSKLAVGYQLPIGDMRVNVEGLAFVATITENDVIAREEVEVPAGKFKCYVIQQTIEMNMMGVAAVTTTKTWYSRGVGAVKRESTMGSRIISRQELVTFKK